jgi:hypothetical protein
MNAEEKQEFKELCKTIETSMCDIEMLLKNGESSLYERLSFKKRLSGCTVAPFNQFNWQENKTSSFNLRFSNKKIVNRQKILDMILQDKVVQELAVDKQTGDMYSVKRFKN